MVITVLYNWGERERGPSCGLNGRAVTIYIYIYIYIYIIIYIYIYIYIYNIYIYIYIRKYGSTFYIALFWPMGKLKFEFSL